MANGKSHHILNAASNLLGICFIIITGLKLTNAGASTVADDISLFAALSFLGACFLSYLSIRIDREAVRLERCADYLFLIGTVFLFIAIAAFSRGLL